jgi:hypothetical protein
MVMISTKEQINNQFHFSDKAFLAYKSKPQIHCCHTAVLYHQSYQKHCQQYKCITIASRNKNI